MPRRPKEPLRVLIADDHRLFAEALEAILAADERIEVVGQAGDGGQAVELANRLGPDVVLMDVSMPVLDGFEATREIRDPDLDERPDPLLESRLPRERERLLPALSRLRRVDALLEPVVARNEELLDPLVYALFHRATLTARMDWCPPAPRSPSRSAC